MTLAKPGRDLRRVQGELARAEIALSDKLTQVTDRIIKTECPRMPLAQPRSTDRVSYSVGGAYTFSSSAPTSDPSGTQRHTHRHTDATGAVVSASTEHVGAQECAGSVLLVAGDSVHLHVHIFNDPSAAVAGPVRRPMHLYVDPDAPPTHGPYAHGDYRIVQTERGPKLMVEPAAADRAKMALARAKLAAEAPASGK